MALPNTETREKIREVSTRSTDGKNILSSKTKNLRELLLQKYEAKKVRYEPSEVCLLMMESSIMHVDARY
jgi:hypothetical protein